MQENVCLAKCTCTFGMQSAFPKFLGQCTCGFMNVECQIGSNSLHGVTRSLTLQYVCVFQYKTEVGFQIVKYSFTLCDSLYFCHPLTEACCCVSKMSNLHFFLIRNFNHKISSFS